MSDEVNVTEVRGVTDTGPIRWQAHRTARLQIAAHIIIGSCVGLIVTMVAAYLLGGYA